jgi:hypothetical protein
MRFGLAFVDIPLDQTIDLSREKQRKDLNLL